MKGKRSVMKMAKAALDRQSTSRHKRRVNEAELRKQIKKAMKDDVRH
jgi:hypothetical protein